MADQSDQSDPKPWTIKNVAPEERNAAIAAAKRDKMDLGPWISLAIRQKIQADRQVDRAPVPIEIPENSSVRPTASEIDLTALERMMAIAEKVAAMSGKPLPQDIRGKTHKLLRVGLRTLDGPTKERPKSDQVARSD
jgi:hypothetical protein